MTHNKNLAILVLSVSAAVLTAALVLTTVSDQALADASTRGGDYLWVAGEYSAQRDLIYIVDLAAQKMNAYAVTPQLNGLQLFDQVDLKKAFQKN